MREKEDAENNNSNDLLADYGFWISDEIPSISESYGLEIVEKSC